MTLPTQGYLNSMNPDFGVQTQKPAAGLFQQFGIMSPSEKQQQAQQAQMAQQMYQQQMQQMAQQRQMQLQQMRLNQANVAGQLGSSFAFPTFVSAGGLSLPPENMMDSGGSGGGPEMAGLMKMFGKGKQQGDNNPDSLTPMKVSQEKQAGGIPMSADSDSIASKIVNDAFSQYGDTSQAATIAGKQLSALGQQRGDQHLASIGANLMAYASKKQKEEVDLQAKQQDIKKTGIDITKAEGELNNPGNTFQGHAPNGDLVTYQPQFENGQYTGLKVITQGPNKQINQALNDPRTDTQRGDEFQKFQQFVTDTEDSLNSMQTISESLAGDAKIGWAGKGVELIDNVIGTLNQLAPNMKMTSEAQAKLNSYDSAFEKMAAETQVDKSRIVDLVSSLAKTYNSTGGGNITEKDIVRAAGVVGGMLSSKKSMAAVLNDAGARAIRRVGTRYKYMSTGAKGDSQEQFDTFQKTWKGWGKPKTSTTPEESGNLIEVTSKEQASKLNNGDRYRLPGDPPDTYRIRGQQ